MSALDFEGLNAHWIVIDNNSSDHTRNVAEAFATRLNLTYLFENRPGKNCALNKALDECTLGEILIFTDDDVTPQRDWLQQIVRCGKEQPDFAVFGGKIDVVWPSGSTPAWARSRFVQMFGFSFHDYGPAPLPYPKRCYPFGPNFWVRRTVFEKGYRYDTRVGPRPKNRIMGSETTFLHTLAQEGYSILYWPDARVKHRIEPEGCTQAMIRRRAYRLGRSAVYIDGIIRPELRERSEILWRGFLVAKLCKACGLLLVAFLSGNQENRLLRAVLALRTMGHVVESLSFHPGSAKDVTATRS